jgi:MFS family permease
MGLINALGNLGGFVGPYVGGYLQTVSHGSFLSTSIVLAVALLLGGLVMLTLRGRANPARLAEPSTRTAAR